MQSYEIFSNTQKYFRMHTGYMQGQPLGVSPGLSAVCFFTECLIPAAEMLFQGIDFLLFAAFPDGGDEAFGGEGEV